MASMPQTRCTFLGYEYMLEPGTQDHPDNLTNPVQRNPTLTTIVPSDGMLISIRLSQNHRCPHGYQTEAFNVLGP